MSDPKAAARAAHCRRMAMDTYALADRTDEPEIIAAYLEIAVKWLQLAERAEAGGEEGGRLRR